MRPVLPVRSSATLVVAWLLAMLVPLVRPMRREDVASSLQDVARATPDNALGKLGFSPVLSP